ncbi:putative mannan synthase 11 isoform X1 [Iris pallida]|uniref:Mannan synthase 11 isoform X1 n=1 Tax=Iris pallida TaxID=29817 RepID=A0AAX6FXX4_IRIPA|nr:putative mannan synthase 11 isoform X1 [Iris pallida]
MPKFSHISKFSLLHPFSSSRLLHLTAKLLLHPEPNSSIIRNGAQYLLRHLLRPDRPPPHQVLLHTGRREPLPRRRDSASGFDSKVSR